MQYRKDFCDLCFGQCSPKPIHWLTVLAPTGRAAKVMIIIGRPLPFTKFIYLSPRGRWFAKWRIWSFKRILQAIPFLLSIEMFHAAEWWRECRESVGRSHYIVLWIGNRLILCLGITAQLPPVEVILQSSTRGRLFIKHFRLDADHIQLTELSVQKIGSGILFNATNSPRAT